MKIRVVLEKGLEEQAALWTASQRREMARVFRRWARQLIVSANIMTGALSSRRGIKVLPKLSKRKQRLN